MTGANLGCGEDHRDGLVNVDVRPTVDPDVVADLDERPWPFDDGELDFVLMDNVLEHLDDTEASIRELARVIEPGGRAVVAGPHPNSVGAWQDPSHVRPFWPSTFDHYLVDDLFDVEHVEWRAVRFGRALPAPVARRLAEHIGHVMEGFTVELSRTGVDP